MPSKHTLKTIVDAGTDQVLGAIDQLIEDAAQAQPEPAPEPAPELERGKVLVLRTCNANMSSNYNPRFVWPKSGPVQCPDWDPKPECGHGLHGLLWGEGSAGLMDWASNAKWLVVEVYADELVSIYGDKVKFPRGEVVYAGDRAGATSLIAKDPRAKNKVVHGLQIIAGDNASYTGGQRSTVIVGKSGHASTGDYTGVAVCGSFGSATAKGRASIAVGQRNSKISVKDDSIAIGRQECELIGTCENILVGGYRSTVAGGYRTVAVVDNGSVKVGTASVVVARASGSDVVAGDDSVVVVNYEDKVKVGPNSLIVGRGWYGQYMAFPVDGVTVKANTWYRFTCKFEGYNRAEHSLVELDSRGRAKAQKAPAPVVHLCEYCDRKLTDDYHVKGDKFFCDANHKDEFELSGKKPPAPAKKAPATKATPVKKAAATKKVTKSTSVGSKKAAPVKKASSTAATAKKATAKKATTSTRRRTSTSTTSTSTTSTN